MAIPPRDRKIVIQRYTSVKNTLGEGVPTWTEFLPAWASVSPISDGERWRADTKGATVTDRFVIGWSIKAGAVLVTDRILFDGKTFDIHAVKEIGRRNRIEITASAVVPNG